jgi:queuine tRNA-ribosyltransferase
MATRCCSFELRQTAQVGDRPPARRGVLRLPHGEVQTPAFMPVGTAGTVKGLTPEEVEGAGAEMILANTYHLWQRPGHERVAALGGLHRMMGWRRPILTDSGGYQVFSLGAKKDKRSRVKLSEEGVTFCSHLDGQWRSLTPELAVEIQETLGVDVAMALDECIAPGADRRAVIRSTARTTRWLGRCLAARRRPGATALFGIVQGGFFEDLRVAHAGELSAMDLDGYAIGGLSVGEEPDLTRAMVRATTPHLPSDRVRYLMGVGYPLDIVEAVLSGVDLFDCVLPTRSGRFGQLFTTRGRMAIKHSRFRDDPRPIDPDCACYTCRSFSRAYLRHLHTSNEVLAPRLLTLHNVTFYQDMMARLRAAVDEGPRALEAVRADAVRWQRPYSDEGA